MSAGDTPIRRWPRGLPVQTIAAVIDQFRAALVAREIAAPAQIIADGHIHRCDAAGKNGKGDAAYLLHLDGIPAGGFENWRDGKGWENWRADTGRKFSAVELTALGEKAQASRRERETLAVQRRAEARTRAVSLWRAAQPAPDSHPYLLSKQVRSHGLRVHRGCLVVPLRDASGALQNLQFIGEDGAKRFLKGGRVRGCYYGMGEPAGELFIVEGYATGATVHEATGHAVAVAFDAGNLPHVAAALRAKFPDLRIVLCADNDTHSPGNPGLTKAIEAARRVNGLLTVPDFGRACR
jgi:putative DNA primase/helicase